MRGSLAVLLLAAIPAGADDVTLRKAKYDDLARYVAAQKGKVVLVDFWATFCPPCRRTFPHVVALHRKYQQQGLVVISVSVDDPTDAATVKDVKAFLAQNKATMMNVLLDETPEMWSEKLKADGIPVVFAFDRAGKIEKRWDEAPKADELEALIVKLLKKDKP